MWELFGGLIKEIIIPSVNGDNIRRLEQITHEEAKQRWDIGDAVISEDTNCFCKLIYMMTLLLDGKEINDLLTTLVSEFDNIGSFIKTLKELELPYEFGDKYKMFSDSETISADLQLINSFARMQKPSVNAKKQMYKDALEILGMDTSEEAADKYIEAMLAGTESEKKKRGGHDFRNFIVNSVIKSSRFEYLVKYSSIGGSRELAKNGKLIMFVLRELPPLQIDRHYSSCGGSDDLSIEGKILYLAKILKELDFRDFESVKTNKRSSYAEKQDKGKKQAVIGLYLTVLYRITKNMININSRYVIAFRRLEYDFELHGMKLRRNYRSSRALTQKFIEEKYLNKNAVGYNERVGLYMTNNISCTSDAVIKLYRNQVDHFTVLRDLSKYAADINSFGSWFELYHYVMQRIINAHKDDTDSSGRPNINKDDPSWLITEKYLETVLQKNTCCKDLIKALNTPFGYNLARYKNLSIGDLFDKHRRPPKVSESAEAAIPETEPDDTDMQ